MCIKKKNKLIILLFSTHSDDFLWQVLNWRSSEEWVVLWSVRKVSSYGLSVYWVRLLGWARWNAPHLSRPHVNHEDPVCHTSYIALTNIYIWYIASSKKLLKIPGLLNGLASYSPTTVNIVKIIAFVSIWNCIRITRNSWLPLYKDRCINIPFLRI